MPDSIIAYCGPPAFPDDVWTRWNVDPLLIGILVVLAIVLARGRSSDARAGWAAVGLMFIIFVSPLCAMSSALFSIRVLHHVLLIAVVAPLLSLAFPQRWVNSLPIAVLVAGHAIVLWLWHTPGLYTWGLASVPAYWLMQISLLGSAWLLWQSILTPAQPGPALIALAATIGQMGLLGALIVFAPRPLYLVHFASATSWGIAPLTDQQLAGLLMWVPAMLPYLGVGLWIGWSSLRSREAAL